MRLILIANPGDRRVVLRQAARARAGLPPAEVLPYVELLSDRTPLSARLPAGAAVQFESPGRNWPVEQLLIAAGAEVEDAHLAERISAAQALRLEFDRGRLRHLRQWYLGWRAWLHHWEGELRRVPGLTWLNRPSEIAVLFGKSACREHLAAATGVAMPRSLGRVLGFEPLLEQMRATGIRRVFVKPDHGSSGIGVVALAWDGGDRFAASSTVELVPVSGGRPRLYNTRRVRRLDSRAALAELIDALAPEHVFAEQWVPKAAVRGRAVDLRVVVTAGRATHIVVRMSRTPITNLHLLNERCELSELESAGLSQHARAALLTDCEAAADAFPGMLMVGVDAAVAVGLRRHALLELNAFGDLLPDWPDLAGLGRDTYDEQTAAFVALAEPAHA